MMRTKWALILFLISIVVLASGYFIVIEPPTEENGFQESESPVELELFEIYQVTNDPAQQENPVIHNNILAWQDDRHGNWDIYMFDLETARQTRITSDESDQLEPRVFGDNLIWRDMRNNKGDFQNFPVDYNSDIYMYNLTSHTEQQVTTNEQGQFAADINNNYIVWLDYRSGFGEVYLYDLTTQQERKISNNSENCSGCKIENNTVIWRTQEDGKYQVYMYNIKTNETQKLAISFGHELNEIVFDDRHLAWSGVPEDGNNSDIFVYTFSTSRVIQVTTNETLQFGPELSNDYLLWTDLRNDPKGWIECPCKSSSEVEKYDNWDIYLYDLSDPDGTLQQLTSEVGSEFLSDVYEGIMIYISEIQNKKDVCIMKFKPE
jgi:beta propeller repeat protein